MPDDERGLQKYSPEHPVYTQPPAVSQWGSVTIDGKAYNATFGLEGALMQPNGDYVTVQPEKFVVVIYTGRKQPLYCRGESLDSFEEAFREAAHLIMDLEEQP